MIGVVGPDPATCTQIAESIEGAGADVKVSDPTEFTSDSLTFLVAHTDPAVIDSIHAGLSVSLIPIDTDPGLPSLSVQTFDEGINCIVNDGYDLRRFPLLSVALDGPPVGCALFDVMLITDEPTTISEYRLSAAATTDQFRADGVVLATPIGSHGYAHAAAGPRIVRGADAVVTVPIAEFSLHSDRWVFPLDEPITVTCLRDEASVGLQLDGRLIRSVPAHEPITVTSSQEVQVVTI